MRDRKLFFPDDIDRINKKYFSKIRAANSISTDPSYWYSNYTEAALSPELQDIKNYRSDYGEGLKIEKPTFLNVLSQWDQANYEYNDITLCSSTTAGSLILLCYLKSFLKIDCVCFETPSYFASLKQAELLGFDIKMLPTYVDDNFNFDFTNLPQQRKIVWLTQPRYGLGKNYEKVHLQSLLSSCQEDDIIVIDEATEQLTPSHLAEFNFLEDPRILKIRTPFKGIGINGPRLSILIHGEVHRAGIQIVLEQVQGAMDTFSLSFAFTLFQKPQKYLAMLETANSQIISTYLKLQPRIAGTQLTLSQIENGYISSVLMRYGDSDLGYSTKRERLLSHCAKVRMPVILGANLNFARDDNLEIIRLNYFNKLSDLALALEYLSDFSL